MKESRGTSKIIGVKFIIIAAFCIIMTAATMLLLMSLARHTLAISSNSDHGDCFNEVAFRLSTVDYEVTALFDRNNEKLLEWTNGDEERVETPAGLINLANCITLGATTMVHNHTIDATFSINDLIAASEANCKRQIVVSPGHLYYLEAIHGWPSIAEVRSFLAREIYNNPTAEQDGLFVRGDTTVDGADKALSTDLLIALYAQEFSLTYRVTPINY